jgi:kinesin family protein 2/24
MLSRAASPMSARKGKSPIGGGSAFYNSNNNDSVVGFHLGTTEETSWAAQIGRLRESFEREHVQHLSTTHDHLTTTADDDNEDDMRIRVIVRKRPMSKRESSDGSEVDVVQPLVYNDYGRILIHQPKTKLDLTKEVETTSFAFDNAFDELSNNSDIYEKAVQSLIPGLFRGKWASVFAYGQTGSGKTFTMMGSNATGMRAGNQAENNITSANLGLYYLAAQDVFRIAEDPAHAGISIGVSLFEIYGGKLLDLLNARNPVRCLEDSRGKVCFPGLSEHPGEFIHFSIPLISCYCHMLVHHNI